MGENKNIENMIEWLTGDDTLTVSLTQKRFINRVRKLSKANDAVQIVAENADGSICAHLPIKALHLFISGPNTGSYPAVDDLLEEDEDEDEA